MSETEFSPRSRSAQQVGVVGLVMNLLLFGGKFFAGLVSNSIAIIADAFNSLADCTSAIVTFLGFKMAAKKRDDEHPYGHGRMEYVAGFLVSVVIILTAWSVGGAAIQRLMNPEPVEFSVISIVICVAAILAKAIFAVYAYKANKTVNSHTLGATVFDSASDCFATTLSMLPVVLSLVTDLPIDGTLGLVLALFIAWSGLKFFWTNTTLILGQGLTKKERAKIREVVHGYDAFERILALDAHDYGPEARILLVKVHLGIAPHSEHFEYELESCRKALRNEFNFSEVVIYWPPTIYK
jgi:cation diffusion facilitator family transporter